MENMLGEHIENLGNIVRTHQEPVKNEKNFPFPQPPPPPTKNNKKKTQKKTELHNE